MNVLLTCAGRRTFIVRAFQEALRGAGQVIACDSDAFAPALTAADQGFVVPDIDDPDYVNELLAICRRARVGLVIPSMETELPLLATYRKRFLKAGAFPMVSSSYVNDACN